ncbi:hypothetical protein E2K66_24290, partial [Escherichia coli]
MAGTGHGRCGASEWRLLQNRRKAFGCLPKVPGFRAGHPTEIKEKQKRLIGYMFQSHPSSEE